MSAAATLGWYSKDYTAVAIGIVRCIFRRTLVLGVKADIPSISIIESEI